MTTRKSPWYQAHCERLMVAMAAFYEALTGLAIEARGYIADRSTEERRMRAKRSPPTPEEEEAHIAAVARESAEVGDDLDRIAEQLEREGGEAVAPLPENV